MFVALGLQKDKCSLRLASNSDIVAQVGRQTSNDVIRPEGHSVKLPSNSSINSYLKIMHQSLIKINIFGIICALSVT